MKVLITGREGQLARSLVSAAHTGPRPAAHTGAVSSAGPITVVAVGRPELDLTDAASIAATIDRHRPDLVVNAAAYTAVDKAESDEAAAMAVNGAGAGHVARACADAGVPIIHISTDYIFDGSKPAPYVESDPVAPLGVYGRSKLDGERQVAAATHHHLILRTAWVVSPYGHNFVKTMLRLAATRPELGVVADQVGTPTYAPHLADAILRLADRIAAGTVPDDAWGLYHAAGTGEATWFDLATETFRLSAARGGPCAVVKPITTAEYSTPARRPANSRLDGTRLATTFGIRLPPWTEGVARCLAALDPDAPSHS